MMTPQPTDSRQLPGTEPLTLQGDLAEQMVAGLGHFLARETEASQSERAARWERDVSSHAGYVRSVEPNRERFRRLTGVVDAREPVAALELVATTAQPALVGVGPGYEILAVRWPVLPGLDAEGLLLQPEEAPVADVVALPDCDATPEMLAGLRDAGEGAPIAQRLAENGCRVLVPLLMDRRAAYSGTPGVR